MSNKAVFLDRDDTLIEDPGYLNNPDQVRLLRGAADSLIELRNMGYKLVVVTNQSGVARGIVTEEVLDEIHDRMKQLLGEQGAFLDQIYYCPYHPEGVIGKYRRESEDRKPGAGMLLTAASEMDIDLGESWVIGNSGRDIEAGQRAGCRTILVEPSYEHRPVRPGEPRADYKSVNIREAVNIIKKHERLVRTVESASHGSAGEAASAAAGGDWAGRAGTVRAAEARDTLSDSAVEPSVGAEAETPAAAETAESPSEVRAAESETAEGDSGAFERGGGSDESSLLAAILEQLKRMERTEAFGEFSTMRFLAGMVQMLVVLCLLATVWLLLSPARQDSDVLIALGFGAVFQVMALTFYTMHGRR